MNYCIRLQEDFVVRPRSGAATVRQQAGTGTQLDLLSAQTALTEARTTQIQALHDYAVALAQLERAIGADVSQKTTARLVTP